MLSDSKYTHESGSFIKSYKINEMKIGFDYIATIGGGGNSRYSDNLIKSLSEIDKENEYYLYGFFHDRFLGRKIKISKPNFKFRAGYFSSLGLSIPENFIRGMNKISIRFSARLHNLQAFHFTNPLNFIPDIKNSIVTIHDLASIHEPSWVKEDSGAWFNSNVASILSGARKIIAVSNFTKKDIIQNFSIDEDKIKVIHEAAEDIFYPDNDSDYVLKKFGLNKYILYAGELQPRKNIIGLLSAYGGMDSGLRDEYKLVLAGSARDRVFRDRLAEEIGKLKLENNVIRLGRVSNEDLRKLYSCAKVFIFVSLFEGFGLPVLEALQCGTPVIVSNASSLTEIVENAGILVDPNDTGDIKSALEKILSDENLCSILKKNCAADAARFNWLNTAKETMKVYYDILR